MILYNKYIERIKKMKIFMIICCLFFIVPSVFANEIYDGVSFNTKIYQRNQTDISRYITFYYRTVPPQLADIIAKTILDKSCDHKIPFQVVLAVIEVESSFNPFAISKKGARGLMQVMYSVWGKELNLKSQYQLHDLEIGIDCGIQIIKKYLKQTKNDMRKTLYKYVGGDSRYGKRVYECIGKFIVFQNFKTQEEHVDEKSISDEKLESLITPTTYIVQKGDTLGSISEKTMGNSKYWREILKYNPNIDPKRLQAGQEILIPVHEKI